MIDDRWEHGSEFDWRPAERAPGPDPDRAWLAGLNSVWFASGRGALAALVERNAWPRVWLPSYVCSELLAAVGDRARCYACDPLADGLPSDAEPGDAVVRIHYFGLRTSLPPVPSGLVVIADHTHDPFGAPAHADQTTAYGFASLRKSLPLPDGAVLWSRDAELPPPPEPSERAAAKLPAMLLKALYLAGHPIDKPVVRELAIAGEAQLTQLGSVGMSRVSTQLLATLAVAQLRAQRRENFATFAEAIGDAVELLRPDADATPFACVVRLRDRAQRERVRARLIEQRIYPAVLWDLDSIPNHRERFPASCELADQLLALHCDARYGSADMQRVAATLRRACA